MGYIYVFLVVGVAQFLVFGVAVYIVLVFSL